MQNICKCYQNRTLEKEKKERICDDIIKTASFYVNPELKEKLNDIIIKSNEVFIDQQNKLENFDLR